MNRITGIGLAVLLAVGGVVAVLPGIARAADDPWQQVLKREFGTCDEAMKAIRDQVMGASRDDRPALEVKVLAIVDSPDATYPAKQFACRMLRYCGSAKCTPAMGKLLTDEKLSHMARWVLQGIADPAAEKALLAGLANTTGGLRIGVIETLGERHGPAAVGALAKLLADKDVATVQAVLKALGKIRTPEAFAAIEAAKVPEGAKGLWCDTMLIFAKKFADDGQKDRATKITRGIFDGEYPAVARTAALGTLIAASKAGEVMPLIMKALNSGQMRLAQAAAAGMIAMPGQAASKAFADALGELPVSGKVVVLNVLGARNDKSASGAICKAVADKDAAVQAAAIQALATAGDADSVAVLAGAIGGDQAGLAKESLAAIQGDGVVAAMLKIAESGQTEARKVMFDVLSQRKESQALPVAYGASSDADTGVRLVAIRTLGTLGGSDDVARLAGMYLACKDPTTKNALGDALAKVAIRTRQVDPILAALAKANDSDKVKLIEILGGIQGNAALAAVKDALGSSDLVLKQAAVSALKGWKSREPADVLLKIATDDADAKCRILALQGYINMADMIRKDSDRLAAYKTALKLAQRADEKRQTLAALGSVRSLDALELAKSYFDDPAVKNEALASGAQIAIAIAGKHPAEAKPVLEKFVAKGRGRSIRWAKKALEDIEAKSGKKSK